jgi:fructose-bisphosphate aldolase class II
MLKKAVNEGYSVPAFNIFNELSARAIVRTCEEMGAPVILQTSVSTVRQVGPEALIGFLRGLAERASIPVAVHLDHCTDVGLAKKCVDLGWSSVMIDASKEPLAVNIQKTREVVQYAAATNVSVEGELGAIVGVEDHIVVSEDDARLASVADSVVFVRETGVDAFAPAVGTAHGLYKAEPRLDFDRFQRIRESVPAPLVVHGGTGLSDEAFHRFVALGASKINISTALKVAYCGGLKGFFEGNPGCGNPLKVDACAYGSIAGVCKTVVQLFSASNRA